MRRVIAIVTLLVFTACRGNVLVTLGLAQPTPGAPVDTDYICDRTKGSTCTTQRLRAAMESTLPACAARPGSRVRLWEMGSRVEEMALLASAEVPATLPNRRQQAAAVASFVDNTSKAFVQTLSSSTPQYADKASPIAASITRAAWAGSDDRDRLIIVISDGREVSKTSSPRLPRISLECDSVDPVAATAALQADGILTPKSLARTDVAFAFTTVGPIDGGRCAASMGNAGAAKEFWLTALQAAGARSVKFGTDSVDVPVMWRTTR